MYLQWWWQLEHSLPCGDALSTLHGTPQLVQQPLKPAESAFEHDESVFAVFGGVCWR